MTWTHFWDMHSGGGKKEPPYEHIYIEAPEDEAKVVFYNRFGHNPERISCTCCGEDYSISESETLDQLTGYHRGCRYDTDERQYVEEPGTESYAREHITLDTYRAKPDALFIEASEIVDDERVGEVPTEGWVWA